MEILANTGTEEFRKSDLWDDATTKIVRGTTTILCTYHSYLLLYRCQAQRGCNLTGEERPGLRPLKFIVEPKGDQWSISSLETIMKSLLSICV